MNKWEVDEHKQWSEKVRSQHFCPVSQEMRPPGNLALPAANFLGISPPSQFRFKIKTSQEH